MKSDVSHSDVSVDHFSQIELLLHVELLQKCIQTRSAIRFCSDTCTRIFFYYHPHLIPHNTVMYAVDMT